MSVKDDEKSRFEECDKKGVLDDILQNYNKVINPTNGANRIKNGFCRKKVARLCVPHLLSFLSRSSVSPHRFVSTQQSTNG